LNNITSGAGAVSLADRKKNFCIRLLI
jgi:hypothetical protein